MPKIEAMDSSDSRKMPQAQLRGPAPPDPSAVRQLDLAAAPPAPTLALADLEQPGTTTVEDGALVLAVGVPPSTVAALVGSIGRLAAGLVIDARQDTAAARQAASKADLPLYLIPAGTSWTDVYAALSANAAGREDSVELRRPSDDLSALADTIARLTGGLVIIEDSDDRLLAYSRSTEDVDELRRLSILGRSGPPRYLALLQQWGVYEQLSKPDTVVTIDADRATGIQARIAVGVFAGRRRLGTIWVQQGAEPFPAHAGQALLGAARLTAAQLVAGRGQLATAVRPGEDPDADADLRSLLNGVGVATRWDARTVRNPCQVVAVGIGRMSRDPVEQSAVVGELTRIVKVQALGYRRDAMATAISGRCYLLIPRLDAAQERAREAVRAIVASARQRLDPSAHAGVGPVVAVLGEAARSRRGADDAYDKGLAAVTEFAEVRAPLLVERTLADIAGNAGDYLDPALTGLLAESPDLATTLRRYLDTGSDVTAVAASLQLHPTTVRYRLRRAGEITGLDLSDPDQRLAAQLQLRLAAGS
jgi:hypothetical protein